MTFDVAALLDADDGSGLPAATGDGVVAVRMDSEGLAAASHELATRHHARLADLFACDLGDGVELRAVYALDAEGRYVVLECPVGGDHFPALSDLDPAAFVEECEIFEVFGIRPSNGKPLNRVHMAPHAEATFARLSERQRRGQDGVHAPHVVEGEAFEFPFGPVRVAGWESLYMGLVTTGEEVLDLYLMHWHKHRATERRLAGLAPERATFLIERIEGLSAVGNAMAFCRAAEAACGVAIAEASAHTRLVALELERIYNHAAAVAAMCQTTGLSVGQANAEIVLEGLLRLNASAFGHRYLFGILCPGGVRDAPDVDAIRRQLPRLCDEFRRVTAALLRTNSHVDRLEATGTLSTDDALRLGLVGPVARACGVDADTRRDHPFEPYDAKSVRVATGEEGDALARMRVMCAEVDASERLVLDHLDAAGAGREPCAPVDAAALGWAESVRGEALAWVSFDERGRIRHARVRPASARNWRAFDDAARAQNVFTDIPIIEASFWLTVAGVAR